MRSFVKGTSTGAPTWTLDSKDFGFQADYASADEEFSISHDFHSREAAASGIAAQVTEWLGAGFEETEVAVRKAPAGKPPRKPPRAARAPRRMYIAPFPDDAAYFADAKLVRCIARRGNVLFTTSGVPGKQFGEIQTYLHCVSDAAATSLYEQTIGLHAKQLAPITRDELAAKYAPEKPTSRRGSPGRRRS